MATDDTVNTPTHDKWGEASVLDLLERLKKELGATPRDLGTRIVNAMLIVDAAIIKVNSDPDRIAAICELDGCYELRAPASAVAESKAWPEMSPLERAAFNAGVQSVTSSVAPLVSLPEDRDYIVTKLEQRVLPEHGGAADPEMKHHWNLTKGDSAMHFEAAACIRELVRQLAAARSASAPRFAVGDPVLVFDRYRFAIPLKATIAEFSLHNDGVRVLLRQSNNASYQIGADVWVHRQQLVAEAEGATKNG